MQAQEKSYSQIVQSDASAIHHYHVPKYQRAYSWTLPNWEQLYDDIDDNEPGHFIGSVICISDSRPSMPGQQVVQELVDGQQRMTTLSLLLAAIHYQLNQMLDSEEAEEFDEEDLDELKDKKKAIGRQLIKRLKPEDSEQKGSWKDGKRAVFLRLHPSSQNDNLKDYRYILHEAGVLTAEVERPAYMGNRRMYKAYNYFWERLPESLEELDVLIEKINRLSLVFIVANSHASAFRLFETLNNRGVPLTILDILKNKVLASIEKHGCTVDEAYDDWQKLLNYIQDGNEERFLRQYYNAFRNDETVQVPGKARATRSNLLDIYSHLIDGKNENNNSQKLLEDWLEKGEIYSSLVSPDEATAVGKELADLNRIGAAPANTLLLYLISNQDQLENEETLIKTVQFLKKYFVRRNLTDIPGTRDMDPLMMEVIDACVTQIEARNKITLETICSVMLNSRREPASLEDLSEELNSWLFWNNQTMCRYLLVTLDETAHSREYCPDLWKRNGKGQYVWTIEHIFPQGQNIPKDWVDMMGGGDSEQAKTVQNEWVHCLGNLTLSGYNSRLSNHSFEKKQAKTAMKSLGQEIQIGYKNGLHLNNISFSIDEESTSLSEIESWTEESLESRHSVMVEKLRRMFCFEHEEAEL